MSGEVEVVEELLVPLMSEGEVDMHQLIDDEEASERLRRFVSPDAPIEFQVPGGGFVGPMGGPFAGPDGYEEGWHEWLGTFDSYRAAFDELIDAGDGKVLLLVTATARLQGSA